MRVCFHTAWVLNTVGACCCRLKFPSCLGRRKNLLVDGREQDSERRERVRGDVDDVKAVRPVCRLGVQSTGWLALRRRKLTAQRATSLLVSLL